MKAFKPLRGWSMAYILFITIMTNIFIGVLIYLVNSYVIVSLLKAALIILNIYYAYYFTLSATLRYLFDEDSMIISCFWGIRKIKLNLQGAEGYDIQSGNIRGVKLSGIGNDRFAFGRTIIDKIGTTHMFVTANTKTFYIKGPGICYAVSPRDTEDFEKILLDNGVRREMPQYKPNTNINLYKEKAFFIPFIAVTLVIIIQTLNPFILYLKNALPATMPLHFNAMFEPLAFGTGKQFAFKQMTYGVLNMIILLCMYYASYFCAKYDRKSAFKYIYLSLITASVFLIMQIRILITFKG